MTLLPSSQELINPQRCNNTWSAVILALTEICLLFSDTDNCCHNLLPIFFSFLCKFIHICTCKPTEQQKTLAKPAGIDALTRYVQLMSMRGPAIG